MVSEENFDFSKGNGSKFGRPWMENGVAASAGVTLGIKSLIAGGFAGVTETITTYPTDYVKTQLQLDEKTSSDGMGKKMYSGFIDCLRKTVKPHGFFGLYRGMTILIFGSFPRSGVRFGAFETLKDKFSDEKKNLSTHMRAVCGLGAGVCESLFAVTPLESIKVKFINDRRSETPRFKGFFHGVTCIFKDDGFKGLYQGVTPTTFKQGANQTIRFSIMETCKYHYCEGDSSKPVPKLVIGLFGAFSGVVSAVLDTPLDVVKTRMQGLEASTRYKNTADSFVKIWKYEGPLAFYKGIVPRMIRVCIGSAVTFVTFEFIMDNIK